MSRQGKPRTAISEQELLNSSFDWDFETLVIQAMMYDGLSLVRETSTNTAKKITVVGNVTYIAFAPPGSAQSSAVWQCQKIDETTGTVVTWADGNANFDNVATDLTVLSYS